jgi:outer membrane protein assembly factor BamB
VVHGDQVVTVGTHAVIGVDLGTGRQAWSLDRSGGPIAMPAIATVKGKPAVLFTDGSTKPGAALVAVALSDRTELWRAALKASSRSGIAVEGGTAYLADDDGNVYAIALSDGSVSWTGTTLGEVQAPPAVADGRVFVTGRDTQNQHSELVAFDAATGRRLWVYAPSVAGSTSSGPSVADGAVITGFADRSIHAFSAQDGIERWSHLALSLFSPATAPAAGPDGAYLIDVAGGLYRLDPATGRRLWDYQLNDLVVRSAPVVSGNAVLVGLNDGQLAAVDRSSADLVWESRPSPGLIGPIAVTGDTIVASKGGHAPGLVAFAHDDQGTLLSVPSPTRLKPVELFGTYAIAAAIVLAIFLLPGRLAATRIGPPSWEAWEDVEDGHDEGAP